MDRQQVLEDLDNLIAKTEKEAARLQEELKQKKAELKSCRKARKAIPSPKAEEVRA
jgi:Skp family chaperone for outer membrane proteins